MRKAKLTAEISASEQLAEKIGPMLAGKTPEVQGAALAQACATFFAGHAPGLREDAKTMFANLVDDLIPIMVEEMIEDGRVSPDWRDQH